MRDYVRDGTVESFVLWNPVDLGYLAVHVAYRTQRGSMVPTGTLHLGRLKGIQASGREVLLGPPMRFDRSNIDQYDF